VWNTKATIFGMKQKKRWVKRKKGRDLWIKKMPFCIKLKLKREI
jgi:hypothetical protein